MEKIKQQKKREKTQVVGCRVPVLVYQKFELKCIEQRIEISEILRAAIENFMSNQTTN